MKLKKITEADLQGVGVVGMEDTPNLSALEMQKKVEEVVRDVVIPAINANVDATASKEDLRMAVLNAGAGDMTRLVYDTDGDGVVDKAKVADNGFGLYIHSKNGTVHTIIGEGENVKFFPAADWNPGDILYVNGVRAYCYNSEAERLEGETLFKANVAVTCVLGTTYTVDNETVRGCFFKTGGAGLNFKIVGGTTQPASPKENMIWINTDTAISSWDFSPQQPPLRSKNKNMLILDAGTTTIYGITFTVNSDGSVTINGTAEQQAILHLQTKPITGLLKVGRTYTMSSTGNSSVAVGVYELTPSGAWVKTHSEAGGRAPTFTYDGVSVPGNEMYMYVLVPKGRTVSGVTFYPQLEKGSRATSFVKGDAYGQVWIKTGENGNAELNVLKKNGIYIFPQSCMQWNGSYWVSKDVKVYKGRQWLALKFWFLQGSNQCTDMTGGWSVIKSPDGSYQAATIDGSGMTFAVTSSLSRNMATTQAIDFTGISTLYISVPSISNASGSGKCFSFGIDETRDFTWDANDKQGWTVEKYVFQPQNATNTVYALDTSSVNSKCYILLAVTCGSGNTLTVVVDEIYGV